MGTVDHEDADVWGGLDDDDFMSINLNELKANNNHVEVTSMDPSKPSTSRPHTTFITSVSSLGTRLGDIVETASKKQKDLNGSTIVYVKAKKKRIVCRRKTAASKTAPLQRFKYGKLYVTDLTTQFWCELQMVFKYEPPPAMVGVKIVKKPEVVMGNTLHLVRELQVEKPVHVKVTSTEDRFALKVLSLLDGIISIVMYGKPLRREIHIFGTPFNMGVYVSGIIDEIRCHPGTLNLEIVEFKTRMSDCMPTEAQKLTHDIQVMLYKRLFDEMVDGTFSKQTVAAHFRMDLNKPLGEDLMSQSSHKEANTLSKLLDLLIETMRGMPFISSLMVEYALQKDGSTIGYSAVEYDEAWIREKLTHAMSYWKGEREPRGVAIEDCWKCARCDYSAACKWKSALVKKYSRKFVEGITPPEERLATQEEMIDPWSTSADSAEISLTAEKESGVIEDSDVVIVPATPKEKNVVCIDLVDSQSLPPLAYDNDVVEH